MKQLALKRAETEIVRDFDRQIKRNREQLKKDKDFLLRRLNEIQSGRLSPCGYVQDLGSRIDSLCLAIDTLEEAKAMVLSCITFAGKMEDSE